MEKNTWNVSSVIRNMISITVAFWYNIDIHWLVLKYNVGYWTWLPLSNVEDKYLKIDIAVENATAPRKELQPRFWFWIWKQM